jgi:hypothetical protein
MCWSPLPSDGHLNEQLKENKRNLFWSTVYPSKEMFVLSFFNIASYTLLFGELLKKNHKMVWRVILVKSVL